MAAAFEHTSVLLNEAIEALAVTPGGRYCDGTVGGGGHSKAILDRCAPDGVLIGLDRDPEALAASRATLGDSDRVVLRQANFAEMVSVVEAIGLLPIDGILLDLGVSSHQIDTSSRGFSFMADGPLDMRMDPSSDLTAAELIANVSEKKLAQLLFDYGEERNSRRIARAIKAAAGRGELNTTADLAALVVTVQPPAHRRVSKIHPATRTFQALRIAVNDELGALDRFLDSFVDALRPGGRVVIISFHSLEDRRVKQRFAELADPCTCPPSLPMCACGRQPVLKLLRKGAVKAGDEEQRINPRARSARLRAAERL